MDYLTDKHLLILGLARQGIALAKFAVARGAKVTVSDLGRAEKVQAGLDALQGLAIDFVLGEHPLTMLDGVDVVAISGSVPADALFVQEARRRGIPITNDSLEFVRRTKATTVGITGSAGKTTTTTLLGMMGDCANVPTFVGGNIGYPLITHVDEIEADDFVVQELSSFQLEIWDQSVEIAGILNITPNHLDRHKTMSVYTEAKANILRFQTENDIAVLCADDPQTMTLLPLVKGRVRLFSAQHEVKDGAFIREGQIWLTNGQTETAVCYLEEIKLRGKHNILNVLAAVTLADCKAIPLHAMRQAIAQFTGVAHRLELVRQWHGVQFINDSIATAPERALAALNAFDEPLVLLAGGRDKDMVWDSWAEQVRSRVKAIVLFGELAEPLETRLRNMPCCQNSVDKEKCGDYALESITRTATLDQAVSTASQLAGGGDVVLLSPGGTSYDAFNDFAERGEHFRELVRRL
jgi:UDP-N-acetylmuramoylalanine--D-glutamate ligase